MQAEPSYVTGLVRRQTRSYDAKLTGGGIELDLEKKGYAKRHLYSFRADRVSIAGTFYA